MIEKYPANLIVKDAGGAVPLLYSVWGDAPSEIIQFLVNSYKSLYPHHEFDWNAMMITLGQAGAQSGVIQNLLHVQQTLSVEDIILIGTLFLTVCLSILFSVKFHGTNSTYVKINPWYKFYIRDKSHFLHSSSA